MMLSFWFDTGAYIYGITPMSAQDSAPYLVQRFDYEIDGASGTTTLRATTQHTYTITSTAVKYLVRDVLSAHYDECARLHRDVNVMYYFDHWIHQRHRLVTSAECSAILLHVDDIEADELSNVEMRRVCQCRADIMERTVAQYLTHLSRARVQR